MTTYPTLEQKEIYRMLGLVGGRCRLSGMCLTPPCSHENWARSLLRKELQALLLKFG